MIRRCSHADIPTIDAIINEAAQKYRGVIPADCWHEPYMSRDELVREITAGVEFFGWDQDGVLVGVMGVQGVRDATLIRHAYVRSAHQGQGIGGRVITALGERVTEKYLVGTWAAAEWAIRFYQGHGFRLVGRDERDRLLRTYWSIPDRQREASVVLIRPGRP